MAEPAISVTGISKRFAIGRLQGSLREEFARWFSRSPGTSPEFWALRDVTFDVAPGDAVAVIGRNGAGKSTLLKILSRITPPTSGRAVIDGRVASLLEVGTGFHPELTGRENVFLNGAILGMTRSEIRGRFDAIVAFSGVERFIDTPVKHFSSGMSVRLAFAVAAFLEPEILIVDEVLAVGDLEFQRKCLQKMESVAHEGRTVLFVSHNMETVQSLCTRGILLDRGAIRAAGPVGEVVDRYLAEGREAIGGALSARTDREGGRLLRFTSCDIRDGAGVRVHAVLSGQAIAIHLGFVTERPFGHTLFWLQVLLHGRVVFTCNNQVTSGLLEVGRGEGEVTCTIPRLPLFQGDYSIDLFAMVDGERADYVRDAALLHVDNGDFFGTGRLPTERQGILVSHDWKLGPGGTR